MTNLSSERKLTSTTVVLTALCAAYLVLTIILALKNDMVSMPHDPSTDPISYIKGALDLLHYDSNLHPPLYSISIAILMLLVGDPFLSAKLVSVLAGTAVILLTYALGKRSFGSKTAGMLGASLVTFSPLLINGGYSPSSEMLGTALFLSSILLLTRCRIGAAWPALATGAVAGLAYLTRYIFIGVVPASVLLLLLGFSGSWRSRLRQVVLFLAAFIVVIAPWTITCLVRHGDLHNINYVNVAVAVMDTKQSDMTWDEAEKYPGLMSVLKDHSAAVGRNFVKNLAYSPVRVSFFEGLLAGAMGVLGFVMALRRPTAARVALLLNGAALLMLTCLIYYRERFIIPLLPLVLLTGAYVLTTSIPQRLHSWWPRMTVATQLLGRVPLRSALIWCALAVAAAAYLYEVPRDFEERSHDEMKRAGEYIKQNTEAGIAVITTSKALTWYADRPYIPMKVLKDATAASLDSVVAAQKAGAVVYSHSAIWDFPQLRFLFNPADSQVPGSFHCIYRDTGAYPVVVYTVAPR